VLPSLAKAIGLPEAIILQQMHYWLRRSHHTFENRPWFYNTYDDWKKQFPFWSLATIRRAIATLEQQKLIESANLNDSKFNKTKWYTLRYENINALLQDAPTVNEQIDVRKLRTSERSICAHLLQETYSQEINKDLRPPLVPPQGGDALALPFSDPGSTPEEPLVTTKPTTPKVQRSRFAPETFTLTQALRDWAQREAPGVDLDYETALFRNHEFSTPRGDWPRAWQNWIRRAACHVNGRRQARNGGMPCPSAPDEAKQVATFIAEMEARLAQKAAERAHPTTKEPRS
jgi:hypothetical protein